eukprot:140442-Karenia_brevis.AAC.1
MQDLLTSNWKELTAVRAQKESMESARKMEIQSLKDQIVKLEKALETDRAEHDRAIQNLETRDLQIRDQINKFQSFSSAPSTQPTQGPAPSSSIHVTPSQMQEAGQEMLASLCSGNPDPSIISSFTGIINQTAAKMGFQGFSFTPVAPKAQESHPGNASSADTGGGGTKRDSSPTPVEQAPRPKEPKTDTQA